MIKENTSCPSDDSLCCPGCDKSKRSLEANAFWVHNGLVLGTLGVCSTCARKLESPSERARRRTTKKMADRVERNPGRYFIASPCYRLRQQAGLDAYPFRISTSDTADDAAWFKANPNRSHRLRPAWPGEHEELCKPEMEPPGCERWVAVRQIEPGWRVRIALHVPTDQVFMHEQAAEFEEVVHAMFDLRIVDPTADVMYADLAERLQRYLQPQQSMH